MANLSQPCEQEHLYGKNIHLIDSAYAHAHLNALCVQETVQPRVNFHTTKLYEYLLTSIIDGEFPKVKKTIETRMSQFHKKESRYTGEFLNSKTRVVTIALARAGILPSHLFYENLNHLIDPALIRQDHVIISRTTDAKGSVKGSQIFGSKIGGDIDKAIVLIPDPMGATASTVIEILSHYKKNVKGKALKFIAAHLVITPEYIRNIKKAHPELEVYTFRIDRGLSSEKILKSIPGKHIEQEKGLNDHQYIVPGAGGLGEVLNNSFV